MGLQGLAVSTLLGISSLLGVKAVPPVPSTWQVTQNWEQVSPSDPNSALHFEAESTAVVAECKTNPNSYLVFPAVVHGSHEVLLDGHNILTFGDPSFKTMRSFFGEPVLPCKEVLSGNKLEWKAYSYTHYFARINYFPYISANVPIYNLFAETFHIIGAGAGLLMAIFTFTMFAGKISRETTLAVCLSSFFSSFYLGGCVAGFFGLPWSMLTVHKFADLGVWTAICLLVKALYHEGLVSRNWFRAYFGACVLAAVLILIGTSGDIVQFGTTIPFGLTLVVLGVPMFKLGRQLVSGEFSQMRLLQFISLGFFVSAVFNEMFAVTGLIHSSPMLPFGFMGAVMFLALAVNVRIHATYQERDYLRSNLEKEVRTQTAKLEKAMSDLKLTQAELVQSAKLASLGTLSAGIAHEINNSLNYVNGALQPLEKLVLRATPLEAQEKIAKLFFVMKDGLNLTFEIIKGLRTYTGMNQAKFNDVGLNEVVHSSLTILRNRIRGQITVNCEIAPDLKVFGLVVGLNQIFMNLISNAVDAMESGGTLNIAAVEIQDQIEITVEDTGMGIEPVVLERIFEPFFTTKDVGRGTGLGLHIVKQEVERHRGQLKVESRLGEGTTFTIRLPRHAMDKDLVA